MKKHHSCLIIFAINIFLFLEYAKSDVRTVGDEEGWNSEANFGSWSEKYNFSVGDVLVFKYVKGQHNVYEVSQATYRSCNASTGVLNKYESGDDRVELTEAKKYWFICNLNGHCLGGMRFNIHAREAKNNATSTAANSTNSTASASPPPANSSTRSNQDFLRWSFWIYIFAFVISLLFHH